MSNQLVPFESLYPIPRICGQEVVVLDLADFEIDHCADYARFAGVARTPSNALLLPRVAQGL